MKGFIFYKSFYEGLHNLDDRTYREIVDGMCERAFSMVLPTEIKGPGNPYFQLIIPSVDATSRDYEYKIRER